MEKAIIPSLKSFFQQVDSIEICSSTTRASYVESSTSLVYHSNQESKQKKSYEYYIRECMVRLMILFQKQLFFF